MAAKKLYIPDVIYKDDEIKILETMFYNGGTYFSDFFTEDDVKTMENNIKSDFPLLMNTAIDRKVNALEKNCEIMAKEIDDKSARINGLEQTVKQFDEMLTTKRAQMKGMIVDMLKRQPDDPIVYDTVSHVEICRLKLEFGMELIEKDNDLFKSLLEERRAE